MPRRRRSRSFQSVALRVILLIANWLRTSHVIDAVGRSRNSRSFAALLCLATLFLVTPETIRCWKKPIEKARNALVGPLRPIRVLH